MFQKVKLNKLFVEFLNMNTWQNAVLPLMELFSGSVSSFFLSLHHVLSSREEGLILCICKAQLHKIYHWH